MTIKRKGKKEERKSISFFHFSSFYFSFRLLLNLYVYIQMYVCVYLENCHQPANKSLYIFNDDDDDKYKRQLIFFPRSVVIHFSIFLCV